MQDAAAIEHACVQFQTSINPAERAQAEAVLQAFRNKDSPYQLCQHLLSHSNQPLAHFHALSCLRDSLLREWSALSREFIIEIRDYLLFYSTNSSSYRALVAQTLALICKRGWWDSNTKTPYIDQTPFFNKISEFMSSSDLNVLAIGVGMLQPLIVEFSTSSKSFQMQLSWEYHFHCQTSFETTKLPEIFVFLVNLLRKVASTITPSNPIPQEITNLMDSILQVIIEVLDWKFNQSSIDYLTTSYKTISGTTVSPGPSWRPLLIDSTDLRDILFQLYPLVRHNTTIGHTVRYVLLLLSSVTGSIFSGPANKQEFMGHMLGGIMRLLSLVNGLNSGEDMLELGGFSQILQRFVSNFKLEALAGIQKEAYRAFLMEYVRLTSLSLQGLRASAAGGNDDLECELEVESFDLLLEGWVSLSNDTEKIMRKNNSQAVNLPLYVQEEAIRVLAECAGHLFGQYVVTRLEMARAGLSKQDYDDDDNEIADKDKYASQLEGVAYLGRLEPVSAANILCKHLNEKIVSLTQGQKSDEIMEETHWLVLLAGFFLADEGDGEVPQVPYFINISSILSTQTHAEDGVVALTRCVLNVAEYENSAQKSQITTSPLLGDTLVWFLTRWSRSYLLLEPSSFMHVSPSLLNAFGTAQGAGGLLVLDSILLKAAFNFHTSRAETTLMLSTCELLQVLTKTKAPKFLHLLKDREAWPVLMASWRDLKGSLAPEVLGNLVSSLVTFSILAGGDLATVLLSEISVPLSSRLSNLLSPNLSSLSPLAISESLCIFRGICKSGAGYAAEWVMGAMSTYSGALPGIIRDFSVHSDIIKLVLNILADFTDTQLEQLTEEKVLVFYNVLRAVLQAYTKEVSSVPTKSAQDTRERYKCAKIAFYTLSALSSASPQCSTAQTTHVIFDGLAAMLPFLAGTQGAELLQFPKLCRLFFLTVNYVISEEPLVMTKLPRHQYHSLLSALGFGVAHHDLAIARNSLEAVSAVASAHRDDPASLTNDVNEILEHFLQSVLKILLYGEASVDDILVPTSEALYPLIQCIPDKYQKAVQVLLSSAATGQVQERLLAAFQSLPMPQRGDNRRESESSFCDSLKSFVANARGFLRAR